MIARTCSLLSRLARATATTSLAALLLSASLPAASPALAAQAATPQPPTVPENPDALARDKALFQSVRQHAQQKQFDRALALTEKIHNPLLRDIGFWLTYATGEGVGDYDHIKNFLTQKETWPRQSRLRRNAEGTLPDSFTPQQVIAWFDGEKPQTFAGLKRLIDAHKALGDDLLAEQLIREIWTGGQFGSADEDSLLKYYGSAITKQDHIDRLDSLIWQGRFIAIKRQLRRVDSAHRKLAEARIALLKRKGDVDALIGRVPNALQNNPGLIYARAKWRLRSGKEEGAIELLDPPLAEVPSPETWWPIRHWAAREALLNGEHEKAYRLASVHGMTEGLGFAQGEWLAGWLALRRLNMPRRAYQHFYTLYEGVSSPISKARAAYWAGRAATEIGFSDWAERWYQIAATNPTTFYGQQAAFALGQVPSLDNFDIPTVSAEERVQFDDKKIVRIIRLLNRLQEKRLEALFLTRLRLDAVTDKDHVLAADLARETGNPNLALRTAKAARQKGVLIPGLLYPDLPHVRGDTPEEALVLALIRQESEFNPNAISRVGARGLMQLMPATAKNVAKKVKVAYKKSELVADPAYNVRLGRAYLSDLIDEFNGSYVMALAGYNAGPHRVRRWIREYGDPRKANIDVIDWIEQIPYSETRNYVQRILESHLIYKQRRDKLPADQGASPLALWGHPPATGG